MRISRLSRAMAASATLAAAASLSLAQPATDNPLLKPSTLPLQYPAFDKIADTHFGPALDAGMVEQLAEVEAIANNPAAATFQNTIVALENSGQVFDRATAPFDQLVSANTNDVLNAADAALAPQRAALDSAMYLNPRLWQRVRTVYDNRAAMNLRGEDAMLLETTYANFVHEGAQLSPDAQAELRRINERLSTLEAEISTDITDGAAAGAIVVDTRAELAGLSDAQIAAAAEAAAARGQRGKFLLSLTNTTGQPLLAQLQNRAVRERLFNASAARNLTGDTATLANIREIISLRTRIAELFGEPDYASWRMYDRYAQNPETAINFMTEMVPALRATQDREAGALQARARQDDPSFTLQPWDWQYYAEIVRREQYALDNEAIKQYFVVDNVLEDGVFYMAQQLYGLTFRERTDIPVYDESVKVYTVYEEDGSELALFYFDPFARDNKSGGAWMNNYIEQSHALGLRPVISNTLNIVPPAEGQPALATWDDVTTMFHEFGHALHGLFADQQYTSLSGTNTARDWVEFPSQFHEPFASRPEVMARYARHWQTNEPIPAALVDSLNRSGQFDQGYGFGEVIAASLLDMEWHAIAPGQAPSDVMAFERSALADLGLRTDLVPPRYRTPYFRHIWNHGYQAGYYSYTWTEMLAQDAYSYVVENGGMNRQMGERIRRTFLGQGHSKSYEQMYRDFTGREPRVEPLLRSRGLLASSAD